MPRECHFVLADKISHNPKIVHSILGLCHRVKLSHSTKHQKKYTDIIFSQKNSDDFNFGQRKRPEKK